MRWETILPWRSSSHIIAGSGTNRVKVVCIKADIWLYVTDQYVAAVSDEGLTSGETGMVVGNSVDESALFYFDNLAVYVPPEE